MVTTKELIGIKVLARDGDMGEIEDVLFDEGSWQIRYLVINTGSWLSKRAVLVAPQSLAARGEDLASVNLSREDIRHSLPAGGAQTLSGTPDRLPDTYSIPIVWWGEPYPAGWGSYAMGIPVSADDGATVDTGDEITEASLRSFNEVKGYGVRTPDDEFGHVENLLVDPSQWVVRALDIDTRSFLPSDHVFLSPEHVDGIDWDERVFRVRLTKKEVLQAPTIAPS